MKKAVKQAFIEYDKGVRPDRYRTPKSWYVLNENGQSYPAKAIWSLATNIKLSDFNTKDARNGLSELDFSLVNTRNIGSEAELRQKIVASLKLSSKERENRLKRAKSKPDTRYTLVKSFNRNPDVVAHVLLRSSGKCEKCKCEAPFKRKTDMTPYLEVHHIKPLAEGGEDTAKNALALCPNCHREAHYG